MLFIVNIIIIFADNNQHNNEQEKTSIVPKAPKDNGAGG
jgi:hypothetical protein